MSDNNRTIHDRKIVKIATPMADGAFSQHFGGTKAFHIYEGDRKTLRLGNQEVSTAPEHKPGSLPKWLEQQEVDAVVVSAIGDQADSAGGCGH